MKAVIYDRSTGDIEYFIDAPLNQVQAQVVSGTVAEVPDDFDGDTAGHHVVDGAVVARPHVHLPEEKTLNVGEVWHIGTCPSGTTVIVDGATSGVVSGDDGLTLSFDYPGVYNLRLSPPAPWVGGRCAVTVG